MAYPVWSISSGLRSVTSRPWKGSFMQWSLWMEARLDSVTNAKMKNSSNRNS